MIEIRVVGKQRISCTNSFNTIEHDVSSCSDVQFSFVVMVMQSFDNDEVQRTLRRVVIEISRRVAEKLQSSSVR